MSLLEVSGLRCGYGIVEVLFGLDLSVAEGELVVVLGANGAGKTTTLRAISGMIPASGSVRLDGTEVLGRRPDQLLSAGVAHVPQGRGTISALSVEDNLRVGGYQRSSAEVTEVARRLRALGGVRMPVPKGVDPLKARPDRKGMRGR